MSAKNNIQDHILNTARKDKVELTVYLLNGVPLKGRVTSFDNFTFILEQDGKEGKQQLVYKHAVSTIIPSKTIKLQPDDSKDNREQKETGGE
ncbi:MAG: RNA chaperone Hfq [Leptospiraceae bacterium]|nr:RNA chaperone Hfq [Leptospiraceae bacterium]MCP5501299.1 RNA chaperone Hfq [Leptospiraceae bacterium]